MAGDWIKMRHSLLRDGRVVRIMSALQADRLRTIGGLFSAWCLFDEQTSDGRLDGYDCNTFDEMVGVPGIARAMESVGWVDIGPDYVEMTGFEQHNGRSAKKRANDSVRKRSGRVSACEADKKRTREEKRREEKSITHTHTTAAEGFEKEWQRWCDFRLATDGRGVNEIQADAILMDLCRRGPEKAKRDIEFSIQKNAKSILDSDHDFQRSQAKTTRRAPSKQELGF